MKLLYGTRLRLRTCLLYTSITLALRRAAGGDVANILDYIPKGVTLLPNTSGARNADEAVRIARLARETGCGCLLYTST